MELISVIIPTFNVEKYIKECIESVLNQSYKEIEIIIVDNNSKDNTLSIINEYQEKYPKLIKILIEINQGAAFARNTGIKHANGSWIQFLDADDILLPQKLDVQTKLINLKDSFISGAWIYHNINNIDDYNLVGAFDIIKSVFLGSSCGQTSSNLWNKKFLIDIGGFDESLPDTNDYELMLRLALINNNIAFSNEPLTIVRDREDKSNLSQQDIVGHYIRHIILRVNIIERLKNEMPNYYNENQRFLWHCVYWFCRLLSSYNLKAGVEAYSKYMPKNFQPIIIKDIDNPKWHLYLTSIIGFKYTETLKYFFRRIIPKKMANK